MYAATRRSPRRGESRGQNYSPDGGGAADLTPPTYLQPKRSADRPSTPKGVGRCAPLTACLRGAKLAGRSAGRENGDLRGVEQTLKETGQHPGRWPGPGVRSQVALQSGVGRFRFSDLVRTPCSKKLPRAFCIRTRSENQKRRVAWCGGGCERRVVRSRGGERIGVVGGGPDQRGTKRERIGEALRLGGAWWLR